MTDLASLVLPPVFKEGAYESYKRELGIWKLLKTCSAKEQGPIVFRTLSGRAKTAALELTDEELGGDTGLDLIIGKLDKLYEQETNLKICSLLDKFESFRRSPTITMSNFILDFERLHNQLKTLGCTYPDGVLAYRLMKASGMSSEHEQLLRATIQ